VCLATGAVLAVVDWQLLQWRNLVVRRGYQQRVGAPPPPAEDLAALRKPLDKMTIGEARALFTQWSGGGDEARAEAQRATRAQLMPRLRALRNRLCPKVRSLFFRSYDAYVELIAEHIPRCVGLDPAGPHRAADVVLFEHQPANFRYENTVVESLIAQQIHTSFALHRRLAGGSGAPPPPRLLFLPPAYKFAAFLAETPKARVRRAHQHSENKGYSERCCLQTLELLAERDELAHASSLAFFQDWLADDRKADDLADAFIQIVSYAHRHGRVK